MTKGHRDMLNKNQLIELALDSDWILAGKWSWPKNSIKDLVVEILEYRKDELTEEEKIQIHRGYK